MFKNLIKFLHIKKVNFFSRDNNLLFSAGDDGNLFIYAIYEYPDGETVAFDDNRKVLQVIIKQREYKIRIYRKK